MITRRALVLAFGAALGGCSLFNRNAIVEERDPYAAERDGGALLERKLSDPAATDVAIEAAFENHALTLLSHSKNPKDQFNYQAIGKMAPDDPARMRKIEVSLLRAMARDYQNTANARKIEAGLKSRWPDRVQAARRATWQMASRTYWFY